MPNEQIRTFLEALLAGKPHHLYVLLWTLATKRSHWFQNVEEAIQRATLSSALDLRSDAHPKQALPATLEAALTILPTELPRSFIVSTGNGAHVWWLFKEPWIFEDDGERKQAATLASRWQSLLNSAPRRAAGPLTAWLIPLEFFASREATTARIRATPNRLKFTPRPTAATIPATWRPISTIMPYQRAENRSAPPRHGRKRSQIRISPSIPVSPCRRVARALDSSGSPVR